MASSLLFAGGVATAEDKAAKPHTVAQEELRIDVKWNVTLVPSEAQQIQLDAAVWKTWLLEEVVPHGVMVKKGDVVLRVRDVELDWTIAKMERDLRLAELALAKAELTAPVTEDKSVQALEAWKLSKDKAAEKLADYNAIDQELDREGAKLTVINAKARLDYEKEELAELEKMYKNDDLNDATEEIVLQRQRNAVRSYDFAARSAARTTRNFDRDEKRDRERIERAAKNAARDEKLTRELEPMNKEERALALEVQRQGLIDLKKKLKDHRADRDQLVQRAAMDGMVYHGAFVDGKFVPGTSKAFMRHAKLLIKTPIITVVGKSALVGRGLVAEKDVGHLKVGQSVSLEAPSVPGRTFLGTILQVSPIPVAPGQYPVEVASAELPAQVVAGAGASVFATPVYREKAVLVPTKLVHRHPTNIGRRTVWVKDGEAVTSREVTTGLVVGDKIEIVGGLKAGELIVPTPKPAGK